MTPSEKLLWEKLRGDQIQGLRFRRQHPMGNFIADFYCYKVKLVVELDGNYHLSEEMIAHDVTRKEQMAEWGVTTLRFNNRQVHSSIEDVVKSITSKVKELQSEIRLRAGPL